VAEGLAPGTKVEVRTSFDRSWSRGFEVVEALGEESYRVRRHSDDVVLPVALPAEDVRRERSRSYWWV
jgi:hypothetical protein